MSFRLFSTDEWFDSEKTFELVLITTKMSKGQHHRVRKMKIMGVSMANMI